MPVIGVIYRHYSKGLAYDGVEEPEEQVVGVSADLALQNVLGLYQRDVCDHCTEANHVDVAEYTNDDVLVEDGGDCEGQQSREAFTEATSNQREVDMPHEPIVDWIVPLAPVLS